jgi:dienelactone hydrolase
MLQTKKIAYQDGKTQLEGYYAIDDSISGKRPAILIAHDWSGRNDFACHKAEKLAELGYIGFALDMYGKDIIGETKEEKTALIQPLINDRILLAQRMFCALETLKKLEYVDATRIAAIGFCFGGLCVLDLARGGADIRGVVSFHGLLFSPPNQKTEKIKAKILAFHGHDDPMVPVAQVMAFQDEMTVANVDWQIHVYGGTMHGFTNPKAHDPGFGTVFNSIADKRSWISMQDFFKEIF